MITKTCKTWNPMSLSNITLVRLTTDISKSLANYLINYKSSTCSSAWQHALVTFLAWVVLYTHAFQCYYQVGHILLERTDWTTTQRIIPNSLLTVYGFSTYSIHNQGVETGLRFMVLIRNVSWHYYSHLQMYLQMYNFILTYGKTLHI